MADDNIRRLAKKGHLGQEAHGSAHSADEAWAGFIGTVLPDTWWERQPPKEVIPTSPTGKIRTKEQADLNERLLQSGKSPEEITAMEMKLK